MVSQGRVWWALAGAIGLAIAAHFTLILLAVFPPLSPEIRARATGYTEPFFRQSWAFFAPDPAPFRQSISVRGGFEHDGAEETTPWLPLTEPAIRAVQAQRFSSQAAPLSALLFGAYSLADVRLGLLDEFIRRGLMDELRDESRKPASLIALERAGSAALREAYPTETLRTVQVRLMIEPVSASSTPDSGVELIYPPGEFALVNSWSPSR